MTAHQIKKRHFKNGAKLTIQIFFFTCFQRYRMKTFNEFYQIWTTTDLAELCTFSTASREALFFPFLKYSSLALYHGTRSPAVRAAKCSSPGAGSESSSRICWIVLYRKCIMMTAMLLCFKKCSIFDIIMLILVFKKFLIIVNILCVSNLCVCLCVSNSLSTFFILKIRSVCTCSEMMSSVFCFHDQDKQSSQL